MDAGVQACEELDLEAWFYDEDRWPSGFAGGEVPLRSEEFHSRCLMRLPKDRAVPPTAEVLAEDEQYRYLCYKVRMGDPWHNGTCWVDLLNPETVKAFIDCSYRPYAQRYADKTGGAVKGIFTDEPQVRPVTNNLPGARAVSYSPIIREDFRAQHGYDVMDHVASLFEPVGNWRKVRLHYYRTLGRRFEESFSKQIGDYCRQRGLVWTGHYNGEENFASVITNVGNMMVQYRHAERPGIDWLALHIDHGLNPAKSLSSVANQYGRARRLSEMFGISGQNMNFEDRKWIADWHAVLGINHVCPHLALYSMAGCRKRDYPPTLSPQQPWWPYNGILEDHLARVSYATTVGRFAADVLVVHPLETAQMVYPERDVQPRTAQVEAEGDLFARFERVLEVLMQAHRDWDLGDEEILADTGEAEGGSLRVGEMAYRAVVLPYMLTIRPSTLELLRKFAAAGGAVLAVGHLPELIDAEEDDEALAELGRVARVVGVNELASALEETLPPALRLEGEGAAEVWTHRRVTDGGQIVLLTNTSRLRDAECTLTLAEADEAVMWDPDTGKCLSLAPDADGNFRLHFAPARTMIITTASASASAKIDGEYRPPAAGQDVLALDGPWSGRRMDPNAVTLDFARYSTDGGKTFSDPEPVIGIHERFMARNYSGPLALDYEIEIETVPAECSLVLEHPEMYGVVSVNGRPVSFDGQAYYRDKSFRRTDVGPLLKAGMNTICLELDFVPPAPASPTQVAGRAEAGSEGAVTPLWQLDPLHRYGTEIESIYLVGEFAVEAEVSAEPAAQTERNARGYLPQVPIHRFRRFRITGEDGQFEGDLTPRGYPFYAGAFELTKTFEMPEVKPGGRYVLEFPALEAQVVLGELNGKPLTPVVWRPFEMDITDQVTAGANELKLTIVNSLRNLLGLHQQGQPGTLHQHLDKRLQEQAVQD